MAENTRPPDYESIDASRLYPIRSIGELREATRETVAMEFNSVVTQTPCDVPHSKEKFEIDIEFKVENETLEIDKVRDYLESYSEAVITQEAMVKEIRRDIKEALQTSDVHVESILTDNQQGQKKIVWGSER